jgi:hypothetical protein
MVTFAAGSLSLPRTRRWCDALLFHFNVGESVPRALADVIDNGTHGTSAASAQTFDRHSSTEFNLFILGRLHEPELDESVGLEIIGWMLPLVWSVSSVRGGRDR